MSFCFGHVFSGVKIQNWSHVLISHGKTIPKPLESHKMEFETENYDRVMKHSRETRLSKTGSTQDLAEGKRWSIFWPCQRDNPLTKSIDMLTCQLLMVRWLGTDKCCLGFDCADVVLTKLKWTYDHWLLLTFCWPLIVDFQINFLYSFK